MNMALGEAGPFHQGGQILAKDFTVSEYSVSNTLRGKGMLSWTHGEGI